MKMKGIYWTLWEDGRILHRSGDFNRLLRFTANTTDAIITFGDEGSVVWVQDADKYWAERGMPA